MGIWEKLVCHTMGYVIVSDRAGPPGPIELLNVHVICDVLIGGLPIFQVSKSKANQLFLTSVSSRLTGDEELT